MRGRPWASTEIEYLQKNWPNMSDAVIGKVLGRTATSVQQMRYKHDIREDPAAWSTDEDRYIQENWRIESVEQIGKALCRTPHAVKQRGAVLGLRHHASPTMGKRAWTTEEISYLCENWGHVSLEIVSERVHHSINAINMKKNELGLDAFLNSGEYITLNQLMRALTGKNVSGYKLKSWVENRGMPIHKKAVSKRRVTVVYLDECWKWDEQWKSFIDFSKMEPLALGKEPAWLPEQRSKDFTAHALQRKDPWTAEEDSRLRMLLQRQQYGYAELSEMLRRSEGSIQRRCLDLGLKARPVRADNHGKNAEWLPEHYEALASGIRRGDSYAMIGREIGKSGKAVRGKVYFCYLTEDADKVRRYLGNGKWGDGAPEATVRQGFNLSRTRTAVRKDLSVLDALLRKRMNDLGYDPYWQRFMCMNWDDVGGCAAGCLDCDSCIEFRRIKPQYCVRCGGTFYERHENKFCNVCRVARRRQYQRKWAALNGKMKAVGV